MEYFYNVVFFYIVVILAWRARNHTVLRFLRHLKIVTLRQLNRTFLLKIVNMPFNNISIRLSIIHNKHTRFFQIFNEWFFGIIIIKTQGGEKKVGMFFSKTMAPNQHYF